MKENNSLSTSKCRNLILVITNDDQDKAFWEEAFKRNNFDPDKFEVKFASDKSDILRETRNSECTPMVIFGNQFLLKKYRECTDNYDRAVKEFIYFSTEVRPLAHTIAMYTPETSVANSDSSENEERTEIGKIAARFFRNEIINLRTKKMPEFENLLKEFFKIDHFAKKRHMASGSPHVIITPSQPQGVAVNA